MSSTQRQPVNLAVLRRALIVFPFTVVGGIALGLLMGMGFAGDSPGSPWLLDSLLEGGAGGLAVGAILYATVVVLRLLTNRCGVVLQEIIFMSVGAVTGWAIGSRFDSLRLSAGGFLGLIFGALLGAALKVSTDSKLSVEEK